VANPRRFVGDVGVRAAFQGFNALKGLLLLPLIARLFGASGYGIWSQVTLTITLLAPLLTLRLDAGLVRYLGGVSDRKQRASAFFGCAAVVWALTLIVVGLGLAGRALIAQLMFDDPSLTTFSMLFVVFLAARVNLTFSLSYYRAISAIRMHTALQAVQIAFEIGVLYGLSFLRSPDLADALLGLVAVDGLLLLGVVGDIVRREGFSPKIPRSTLKRFLRFSLPLIPAAAMYWIVNSSDRYVIVHLLGLDQAGVYSAAYRLSQVLKLMLHPVSFVLLPIVSTLWERGEPERARAYLSQSLFWLLVFAMPATAGLIAIGPMLLTLLGTEEFAVSRGLVALLVVGELAVTVYQIHAYVVYLHERTWVFTALFTFLATFNLGLNLLLVPRWGVMGAAVATLASYGAQALFIFKYSRQLMPLTISRYAIVRLAVGSGVVYAVAILAPMGGVLGLLGRVVLAMVAYAMVLWATRVLPVEAIRSLLRSRRGD